MPKKLSTNPKSQESRDRKEAKKVSSQQEKVKSKEDAYWKEASKDDTDLKRKETRAEEAEAKRLAEIAKKMELKALYDEEMAGCSSRPSAKGRKETGKKMTKVQIARRQALEQLARENELKKKNQETSKYVAPEDMEDLPENINRAEQLRIESEGILEARNIDDAISALSMAQGENSTGIDRHPEKRVKSAYKEFEEWRYPEIKEEYPTFKRSQIKQILQKEWKKSKLNPLNQQ